MTTRTRKKFSVSATVAQRLHTTCPGRRLPVGVISASSLRSYVSISLTKMGIELGAVHPNGRNGFPYSKSSISHFEHGRPIPKETQEAYRLVLEKFVQEKFAGLKIRIKFGRLWKVTPLRDCRTCGREFALTHPGQKNCPRCR